MNLPEQLPAAAGLRAVLAAEPDGAPGRLVRLGQEDLADEAVTVRVAYSSLNYKDGLAVTGKGKVVRRFPMVCGVDLAGVVESSSAPSWKPGDQVIGTGWGLGEEHFGGYCERARVSPDWLVRIPEGRDALWAMSLGTAGFTAMLSVLALERHNVTPESADGFPVVVTGAAGGVGSVAVALLAGLGYNVAAVTGRPEYEARLRSLGAADVLARGELAEVPLRPLARERFAGGVDVVGSTTLANVLSQTRHAGCVAACGLAGGAELVTTVHPFILRGVSLVGIDSARAPRALRELAWARLAADLDSDLLSSMTVVESLDAVPRLAEEILAGRTTGRVVIEVAGS
jgi:acrylyl-CoA reductase (NADPH)